MADKLHVRPVRPPINIAHPIDGPLVNEPDADGKWSFWTQDGYTFALLRDGDIERVPDADAVGDDTAPAKPALPEQSDPPAAPARKKDSR